MAGQGLVEARDGRGGTFERAGDGGDRQGRATRRQCRSPLAMSVRDKMRS